MLVKELIEKLENEDQNMEILFKTDDGWCYDICGIYGEELVEKGRIVDSSNEEKVILLF